MKLEWDKDSKRVVFIPIMDGFGTEYDVTIQGDAKETENFLKVWDIDTLKRLLDTAIKEENYEIAEIIKKITEEKEIKNAERKS